MTPELFSGILVVVLAMVVITNVAWNRLHGSRNESNSPRALDAKRVIEDYVGNDSDSRFIHELDLAPFKIVSEELGLKNRRIRKKR